MKFNWHLPLKTLTPSVILDINTFSIVRLQYKSLPKKQAEELIINLYKSAHPDLWKNNRLLHQLFQEDNLLTIMKQVDIKNLATQELIFKLQYENSKQSYSTTTTDQDNVLLFFYNTIIPYIKENPQETAEIYEHINKIIELSIEDTIYAPLLPKKYFYNMDNLSIILESTFLSLSQKEEILNNINFAEIPEEEIIQLHNNNTLSTDTEITLLNCLKKQNIITEKIVLTFLKNTHNSKTLRPSFSLFQYFVNTQKYSEDFVLKSIDIAPSLFSNFPKSIRENEEFLEYFLISINKSNENSTSKKSLIDKILQNISTKKIYSYNSTIIRNTCVQEYSQFLLTKGCPTKLKTVENFILAPITYTDFVEHFPKKEIDKFNNDVALQKAKVTQAKIEVFQSMPEHIQTQPDVFFAFFNKPNFLYQQHEKYLIDLFNKTTLLQNENILLKLLEYHPQIKWEEQPEEILEIFNEPEFILKLCDKMDQGKIYFNCLPKFINQFFITNSIYNNYMETMEKHINQQLIDQTIQVENKKKTKIKI